jgi:PIN domain nuclease of toxin-antitoxin system
VRILLDTHVFLWAITDDPHLSERVRRIFVDSESTVLLSAASVWEIIVKAQAGKLPFPKPAARYLRSQLAKTSVEVLPVMLAHALRVETLPLHHRDPFDRILVAQALEEKIPIASADKALTAYPVNIVW